MEEEEEIVIVLGDTVADVDLRKFSKSKHSVLGLKKVSNPLLFGIAEMEEDGVFIKKLIEKPKIPKSNLALVGIYMIKNVKLLFECIDYIFKKKLKTNGEFQLTDALMCMIDRGEKMTSLLVDHWFDCGRRETLLEANSILLQRKAFQQPLEYTFPKTIIIPPVSIGRNCIIKDSIIGPNVAIGENTLINRSIIQDTIVGSFSELKDVILEKSIIGNDSCLKGLIQKLSIGDSTEIILS